MFRSLAGFPDVNIFDQVTIGIEILDRIRVAGRTNPFIVTPQIVVASIASARVWSDLQSDADRRKFPVQIEVPVHHRRLKIGAHANFRGLPDLRIPAVLQRCNGYQKNGNPAQDSSPPPGKRSL